MTTKRSWICSDEKEIGGRKNLKRFRKIKIEARKKIEERGRKIEKSFIETLRTDWKTKIRWLPQITWKWKNLRRK